MSIPSLRSAPSLLVLALIVGCGDPEATPEDGAAPPAEAAARADAPPTTRGSGYTAATTPAEYQMTMDAVHRYFDAYEGIMRLMVTDPDLVARFEGMEMDVDTAGMSFAQRAQLIVSQAPEFQREFERAGISAHEYMLVNATLGANMHYVMTGDRTGHEDAEWISERHAEFVRANRDEINERHTEIMVQLMEHQSQP